MDHSTHQHHLIYQAIQKLLEENRNKDASGFFFPEEDDDRLLLSRLLSQLESLKGEQPFDQVEALSGQETISACAIDNKVDKESEDAGQVDKGNTEVTTKTPEIDEEPRKLESLKGVNAFDQLEVSSGQETVTEIVIDGGVDMESQEASKVENEHNDVIAKIREIDEEPRKVEIIDEKSWEDAADKEKESYKETQAMVEELRKLKQQNRVTHWLLSASMVLIVAWQLSEVSLILKVKETLNHPFRTLGGMFTGMLKRPDTNGGQDAGDTHIQMPSLKMPVLPHVDLPAFNLHDSNDEA